MEKDLSNERKNASKDILRFTLESMHQGLIMFDSAGNIHVFNQRSIELLDLAAHGDVAELAMSDLMRLLGDDGAFDSVGDATLEEGVARSCVRDLPSQFTWARHDGCLLSVCFDRLPTGGAILTFTDVTAQQRATIALQASEQKFRLLAENTHDVIILGTLEHKRLYVSPAVKSLLGYTPEEFLAMTVWDMLHPDDPTLLPLTKGDAVVREVGQISGTLRYRHKDGHYVWVESSAQAFATSTAVLSPATSLRCGTSRSAARWRNGCGTWRCTTP